MKKKHITLEEALALRGTDAKIYCEENEDIYVKFVGDVVCCYNIDDDSIKAVGGSFTDRDTLYILEQEEFKVEKTGKFKTRDGRIAYVAVVNNDFCYGMICGDAGSKMWGLDGKWCSSEDTENDLVEYIGD